MTFAVIGSAEQIRDLLCGPPQHNEHCKGWRWHLYVADDEKRFRNVMAELRKLHAEGRLAAENLEAQYQRDLNVIRQVLEST